MLSVDTLLEALVLEAKRATAAITSPSHDQVTRAGGTVAAEEL
jgi:hypothetical protein